MSIQPRHELAPVETFAVDMPLAARLLVVDQDFIPLAVAPDCMPDTKIEKDHARELVRGLDEREQDILGLIALGLNNEEISKKIYFARGTIKRYQIPQLYQKLGIDGALSKQRRSSAMEYAWSAGLLSAAWEAELSETETGYLSGTRAAIRENGLLGKDINFMERYGLTIGRLRLSELIAVGKSWSEIASLWSISEIAVYNRAKRLKKHLGSEETVTELFDILANGKVLHVQTIRSRKVNSAPAGTHDEITHNIAKHPIDKLSAKQKDILGLATLGLSSKEIGNEFDPPHPAGTIDIFLVEIYKKLDVPKTPGRTRQVGAREIAWANGLLQEAAETEDIETLARTRRVMQKNKLDSYDINIMSTHGLTIMQLRLLKHKAARLSFAEIRKRESINNDNTLSSRFQQIRKRLGSKEKMAKLVENIAVQIGSTALSTEVSQLPQ